MPEAQKEGDDDAAGKLKSSSPSVDGRPDFSASEGIEDPPPWLDIFPAV